MSSSSLGNVRRLPSEEDLELQRYDVELGLEELKRQLRAIENDKSKELYQRRKEAFNLRQAIKKVEEGKNMPYDEFMRILRENSVPILQGSYRKTEIDPESGKEVEVEVVYDNRFPLPSPKSGLRRRTPEIRSSSPFVPITFEAKPPSRPTTPLLPVTATDDTVVKKKSICPPEGCAISGGIRRRRKGKKTRKVRKSRKNKKSNRKSKRKI